MQEEKEEKEMSTIQEALKENGTAVQQTDRYTIAVRENEEEGGFDVAFSVGYLPPHARAHIATLDELPEETKAFAIKDDAWYPSGEY